MKSRIIFAALVLSFNFIYSKKPLDKNISTGEIKEVYNKIEICNLVSAKDKNSEKYIRDSEGKTNLTSPIFLRIEKYISNIGSFSADFIQKSSDQNCPGLLLVDKNNSLRCNYFAPCPLLIILNKSTVSIYDYTMHSLIKDNLQFDLWNFLLKGEINPDINVVNLGSDDVYDYITMKQDASMARISFKKKPYSLAKIEIIEEDKSTEIEFSNLKNIQILDKSLFNIRDPKIFGKQKRADKKDLEKLFKYKN